MVTKLNRGSDEETGAQVPEQLAAKADPISISKHPAIQAVLHPQPVDDLLPLRPRGHARRVILRRRTKSEPVPHPSSPRQRNQFANQTHVDEVPHDHVCAPVARRPRVGAAAPHHLRPVLHTERRTPSELYQPDRRKPQPNWGCGSKMQGRGAGCQCHARTWDASSLLNPTSKKRTPSNRCLSPMSSSVPGEGEAMVGSETAGSGGGVESLRFGIGDCSCSSCARGGLPEMGNLEGRSLGQDSGERGREKIKCGFLFRREMKLILWPGRYLLVMGLIFLLFFGRVASGSVWTLKKKGKSNFPFPTFTRVRFSFPSSKTGEIIFLNFLNHAFYLSRSIEGGFEGGFVFFIFIYFG